MGIPKFNQWLSKKAALLRIRNIYFDRLPKTPVNSLSFDLNGLIYRARDIVYGKTEGTLPAYIEAFRKMKPPEVEKRICNTVCILIADAVLTVGPKEVVYIAVDGPISLAKMNQQRSRRYLAAASEYKDDPDSCSITPGTMFMQKLDLYIRKWLIKNRFYFPRRLIYSSHLVPCEGEHKIMSAFRTKLIAGAGFHMIYGIDSDLILLSLMSGMENIILIREDLSQLMSINGVREMLIRQAPDSLKETVIPDFVAMMSLIGNDFLPHGILHESIFERIEGMLAGYHDQGLPITEATKTGVRFINFYRLPQIINRLAHTEIKAMSVEAVNQYINPDKFFPNPFYSAAIVEESVPGKPNLKRNVFDWERFRSAWYNNELYVRGGIPGIPEPIPATIEGITDICMTFFEGMAWVFRYYQTINIEVYWYYPYKHPPLMKDLASVCQALEYSHGLNLNTRFAKKFQMSHGVLEQLLTVIPYSNLHNNLPKFLHDYFDYGPYAYMFPRAIRAENYGLERENPYPIVSIVANFNFDEIREMVKVFQEAESDILKPWKSTTLIEIQSTPDTKDKYTALSRIKRQHYDREIGKQLKSQATERYQRAMSRGRGEGRGRGRGPSRKITERKEGISTDITKAYITIIKDGGKEYTLVQDSDLKYGTKMRALPFFQTCKANGFTEMVAIATTHGYGQVAAAWCCQQAGLICTIFVNKEKKRTHMTTEAIKLGANIKEIEGKDGRRVRNRELDVMAKEYKKDDPTVIHIPLGLAHKGVAEELRKNIENIRITHNLNPKRIWVAGGTGTVAVAIGKAFPNAEMMIVEVGTETWKDKMKEIKYQIRRYPHGKFFEPASEMPPYASVANYDAKVWYFVKREGQNGDMIWNIK